MEIRDAGPADAPAACLVMRRSIAELCIADHHNDPEILRRWLANKTPEIVGSWIGNSNNTMLLAVDGDAVLAVGSVTNAGEIQLRRRPRFSESLGLDLLPQRNRGWPAQGRP